MTFAEDKTYEYIRHHYSRFDRIHVLEILPYLSCLTTSDQDLLRATYDHRGNQNTIWQLFNSLKRRSDWVRSLIGALRACELFSLAEEVAQVYESHLPSNQKCALARPERPSVPAEAPGPSTAAVAPRAPHNSHDSDGEPSYPMPVQDTQLPASLGETPSSGAVLERPSGPREPSDMAALGPRPSSGPQGQDTELGSPRPAGRISGLTSPRGPVSPAVSFQPLARSTPRTSRLPGPPVSAPSTGAFSSAGGGGDQAEAPLCPSGVEVPTNSVTASIAHPKVPLHPASTRTVPSALSPTSSEPSSVPTTVPTSLAPSKLPTNSTHTGTVPPKGPTDLVPDHAVPISSVPSKVPANIAPTIESSNRLTEETPVSPAPRGATARGSSPCADSSSLGWIPEPELSKPGRLSSRTDNQPSSINSADLAISYSDCLDSLGARPDNAPEENEYVSVDSLRLHVSEGPSAADLGDSPGLHAAPQLREEETALCVGRQQWGTWLGAAAAGALLATVLAVLYRRRLVQ